jgi:hypothetical protein
MDRDHPPESVLQTFNRLLMAFDLPSNWPRAPDRPDAEVAIPPSTPVTTSCWRGPVWLRCLRLRDPAARRRHVVPGRAHTKRGGDLPPDLLVELRRVVLDVRQMEPPQDLRRRFSREQEVERALYEVRDHLVRPSPSRQVPRTDIDGVTGRAPRVGHLDRALPTVPAPRRPHGHHRPLSYAAGLPVGGGRASRAGSAAASQCDRARIGRAARLPI